MRCALCLMAGRSWLCQVCHHHLDDVSALVAYRTRREKLLRDIAWNRFTIQVGGGPNRQGMSAFWLRVYRRELADLRTWWSARRSPAAWPAAA